MTTKRQTSTSPWVIGILTFFGMLFSVNAFLVYKAISTNNGLFEESPYEKGIAYQKSIDKLKLAKKEKIKCNLEHNNDQVEIHLTKNSKILKNAQVNIKLFSNIKNFKNLNLELKEIADGIYASDKQKLTAGLYLTEIEIEKEGKQYLLKQRAML